jgi:Protein of unknown function (DUF3617)
MRKISVLGGLLLLCASVLFAAGEITPLDVKIGEWETTSTNAMSGMSGMVIPPDMAARMTPEQRAQAEAAMKAMGNGQPHTVSYKNCLKKEDLTQDPFKDKDQSKFKCDHKVIKSTGNHLDVREMCGDEEGKADVHVTIDRIDSEHVSGTTQVVATMGGGHTINSSSKFTSKWVGEACTKDAE